MKIRMLFEGDAVEIVTTDETFIEFLDRHSSVREGGFVAFDNQRAYPKNRLVGVCVLED